MLPPHIHSVADLVTSHSAIRDGFLKQALTKTRKADPFVQEARELYAANLTVPQQVADLATWLVGL